MSFLSKYIKRGNQKKKLSLKHGEFPQRDWVIALSVFLIFFLSLAGFGTYTFWNTDNVEVFVEAPTNPGAGIIDEELLSETIDFYSAKAGEFEQFKSEEPDVPRI